MRLALWVSKHVMSAILVDRERWQTKSNTRSFSFASMGFSKCHRFPSSGARDGECCGGASLRRVLRATCSRGRGRTGKDELLGTRVAVLSQDSGVGSTLHRTLELELCRGGNPASGPSMFSNFSRGLCSLPHEGSQHPQQPGRGY